MITTRSIMCCLMAPVALAQLVSCSGANAANKSLYALDPGRPTIPRDPPAVRQVSFGTPGAARDQVLQVRQANIAPPFDGPSLVYRTPGGTFVKDYYNEWVAPPAELFSTELVSWLSASGPFASVVDGRSAAPHQFELETSITSLYGDFRDPRKPRVVLDARVYLIDDTSGSRGVAFQNRYDISIPVAAASAEQLVLGSGRAYRQLLESVARDLSAFSGSTVTAGAR